MDRAQPEHLSKADILRAKKNVEKIQRLFERGITPGQMIKQTIEMINPEPRYTRSHRREL